MLKKIAISICAGSIMVSCFNFDKPTKPDHFLSKKDMINIILDFRLIASANGSNQNLLQNRNIYSDDYVYRKYNIDSLTFALNNAYYSYYVDDYNEIYIAVKDSLEGLKKDLELVIKEEEKQKRIKDSISRARERDSLNLRKEKDSALKNKLNKLKPKLIQPVLDKELQSQ